MKIGKVEQHLLDTLDKHGTALSIVIDPVDYPSPEIAIKKAVEACEGGADVLAIGGSVGVQGELLDMVAKEIKSKISVPIILFPGNIGTITRYADAMYFLTLLNSRNPYWLGQAQMLGAPLIKQFKIESIPTAYLVVEPGGTVGWVGDAKLLPRNNPKLTAGLAYTGELSGAHMVFTDAGSASSLGPIPVETVRAVKKYITIPYMVAGGIRTVDEATNIVKAGADMIQVGNIVEHSNNVSEDVSKLLKAMREAAKNRI
jgi:phosphoglycerol geranylgeranyltransferase